jgi:asparaginyl-tRNA synthetase
MLTNSVKELLTGKSAVGKEVEIQGWVRTRRGNKNVAFVALNDGSTIKNIQIVLDLANFDENLLKRITTGACIRAKGLLVESMGQGQSVDTKKYFENV